MMGGLVQTVKYSMFLLFNISILYVAIDDVGRASRAPPFRDQ